MAKLYLIQTGQTMWGPPQRVESVAGQPLTAEGSQEAAVAGRQLRERGIAAVYSGDGEAERQTAALLAAELGVKARTEPGLRELDYGLWQGLTVTEIKRRQPRAYRQWEEAPASVRPPSGESLEELRDRLAPALRAILKRRGGQSVVVVLRPVAMALMRCLLSGQDGSHVWERHDGRLTWYCFDAASIEL